MVGVMATLDPLLIEQSRIDGYSTEIARKSKSLSIEFPRETLDPVLFVRFKKRTK
jgi:hypothetical protein